MHRRSLEDWLSWQETLHPRAIDLGLDRVRRVAEALGLPWRNCLSVIVGGTNGKGSSAYLLAQICQAAGLRVGLYTSPHLVRYNERVRIDAGMASDEALCAAFEAIDAARGEVGLTYFEFGTLAALWLFREARVDVQVLEVGLGGRLDATNIVDADAALLTNVGLDHLDWLGSDREQIGAEKAGIFRSGKPAIFAHPDLPASVVAYAQRVGARLIRRGRDFGVVVHDDGTFDWSGAASHYERLPAVAGPAQIDNAAGVLALIEALSPRLRIPEAAVRQALAGSRLPGRQEIRGRWILDVAHNAEAGGMLARCLAQRSCPGRTVLVLGMLTDKPHVEFMTVLASYVDAVLCVGLPPPRGLSAEALRRRVMIVVARDTEVLSCENMRDALSTASQLAGDQGRVVVTGSFLTVAAAIGELDG